VQLKWDRDHQSMMIGGFNYEALRMLGSVSYGGADVGEILDVVSRVTDGDFESWVVEWSRTAGHVRGQGLRALDAGHPVTARQALMRAATYDTGAAFNALHTDPRKRELWERAKASFATAAALQDPPVEVLEIPFGTAMLPAYFVRGGEGQRATVINVGGYDSAAEELYHWFARAAAERGFNVLVVEGPGQVGALHRNPGLVMRPDFEVPISAVVDYLVTRPDVDPERLAIVGYSVGGYLAPRAAAFEPRLKACVSNGFMHDVGRYLMFNWPAELRSATAEDFGRYYEMMAGENPAIEWAVSHAKWSFGITSPGEFLAMWIPYNLRDCRDGITFPLLNVEGEFVPLVLDRAGDYGKVFAREIEDFFASLPTKDKTTVYSTWIEGGALHCQQPGLSTAQAVTIDWLHERLGNPAS
jgi:hypothetical protein